MNEKKWYLSKELWVGGATGVIWVANYALANALVAPEFIPWVGLIVVGLTRLFLTDSKLTF